MAGWEERRAHEAEIRRRWDRDALVSECGVLGAAMAEVVEAAAALDRDRCLRLQQAYREAAWQAEGEGRSEEWERAFCYSAPYPEHPGDLYAIDPRSRLALGYAGLIARERAFGVGQGDVDFVQVERTASGMVMALSVALARSGGWYHPVPEELAARLARPWVSVMGDPRVIRAGN